MFLRDARYRRRASVKSLLMEAGCTVREHPANVVQICAPNWDGDCTVGVVILNLFVGCRVPLQ
jgi:hypothetical protein